MSTRFEAEALIRAAASGAIPAEGDILIRTRDGWIFGNLSVAGLEGKISSDQIESLPFVKVTGQIAVGQVPLAVVKQHEGNLAIAFSQMTDQIADGQVPSSAVLQYCAEILACIESAIIPEPFKGFSDVLGFLLARATDIRPRTPAEKVFANNNFS